MHAKKYIDIKINTLICEIEDEPQRYNTKTKIKLKRQETIPYICLSLNV